MNVKRAQEKPHRDNDKNQPRDGGEEVILLKQEDRRRQGDPHHRQRDQQHDANRETPIRDHDDVWNHSMNTIKYTQHHSQRDPASGGDRPVAKEPGENPFHAERTMLFR